MFFNGPGSEMRGLLFSILSMIQLEGGAIPEEKLKTNLAQLGANWAQCPFESCSMTLQEAVALLSKQMYLQKKQRPDTTTSQTSYMYMFGERAVVEIGEREVLRFLKQCTGADINVSDARTLLRNDDLIDVVDEGEVLEME